MLHLLRVLLLAAAALAPAARASDNVLLVVADDVGVDRVGAYGEHPDPGNTPTVDRLAREGILFRRAWATPYCSPTRATILTGRLPFRTGVGAVIQGSTSFALDPGELGLPELLAAGTAGRVRSVMIGKWHLAGLSLGAPVHPFGFGYEAHAGSLFNLPDYEGWTKSVNGALGPESTYATVDTTDDALRAVSFLPEPWFVHVAYNAPHTPFHAPPPHLHSFALSGDPDATPVPHVKAAIEALDAELGRLLAGMDPGVRARTTVIFVGDNGTHAAATDAPFLPEHAKGTCYEGGLRVPLVVAGPDVGPRGAECGALVQTTDLFATIAELLGVDAASAAPPGLVLDSISLVPYLADPARPSLRADAYAERFFPNGLPPYLVHTRAVREARYKLIRWEDEAREELYDLVLDPFETQDLLAAPPLAPEARAAYGRLLARLAELRAP